MGGRGGNEGESRTEYNGDERSHNEDGDVAWREG